MLLLLNPTTSEAVVNQRPPIDNKIPSQLVFCLFSKVMLSKTLFLSVSLRRPEESLSRIFNNSSHENTSVYTIEQHEDTMRQVISTYSL
jgi:hypothetical protein